MYEYDATARLVSSRPEPEWDDEQQGWMLALAQYRAELHDCGHSLLESADPGAEGRYVAEPPTRCHACTAIAVRQEQYKDTRHPQALLWGARRT